MELFNKVIDILDGLLVIAAVLVLLNGKVRAWVTKKLFSKNIKQDERIRNLERRVSRGEDGQKAILHDLLFTQCRRCIRKDFITLEEMENLKYIYKAYANYGMNGTGKELYERCLKLKIKDNECDCNIH